MSIDNRVADGDKRAECADCHEQHYTRFMIGPYCARCELLALKKILPVVRSLVPPKCQERLYCRVVAVWVNRYGVTCCSHHVDLNNHAARWHMISPSLYTDVVMCMECGDPFYVVDLVAYRVCADCYQINYYQGGIS